MRFCQQHWDTLREMVISKGMGTLIAKSGEDVAARVQEELEGTATNATYDPLMSAYWGITNRALEMGGLYLMGRKPGDGEEYCPLCEVEEQGIRFESKPGAALAWMEGCTDSILVYCRENNLLPRAQ
jgi:hypothetical protein